MSDLRDEIARALIENINDLDQWSGEAPCAADAVLRVVGERLTADDAVEAGAMGIWDEVEGPLGSASFLPPAKKHTIIHNRLRAAAALSAAWRVVTGSNHE